MRKNLNEHYERFKERKDGFLPHSQYLKHKCLELADPTNIKSKTLNFIESDSMIQWVLNSSPIGPSPIIPFTCTSNKNERARNQEYL